MTMKHVTGWADFIQESILPPGKGRPETPQHKDRAGLHIPVLPPAAAPAGFIGTSVIMQQAYDRIQRAAQSDAGVMIQGETGTGKEIAAQAIHGLSRRAGKPFIAVNVAAIPRDLMESSLFGHVRGAFTGAISDSPGAIQQASGGTLFLDEIGEMDIHLQSKLLRFTQDLTIQRVGSGVREACNVRIVCATHRDLTRLVAQGQFREDLFYRLYVIPVTMPPLRARGDDILDLAYAFLRDLSYAENQVFCSIEPGAERALMRHTWPGNVRELYNLIHRIVVFFNGPVLTASMVETAMVQMAPATPAHSEDMRDPAVRPLWMVERDAILQALDIQGGNIAKAAASLDISPSTIYRKKMEWEQQLNRHAAS